MYGTIAKVKKIMIFAIHDLGRAVAGDILGQNRQNIGILVFQQNFSTINSTKPPKNNH